MQIGFQWNILDIIIHEDTCIFQDISINPTQWNDKLFSF